MDEIWKQVPGTEYIASSEGRVARMRELAVMPSRDGYIKVAYRKGTRWLWSTAHSLVAQAFHGERPSPDHQVNHIDFNRTNNRPENLEWVSRQQNVTHSHSAGRYRSADKNPNSATHLNKKARQEIRSRYAAGGIKMSELAVDYRVHKSTIQRIIKGTTWA